MQKPVMTTTQPIRNAVGFSLFLFLMVFLASCSEEGTPTAEEAAEQKLLTSAESIRQEASATKQNIYVIEREIPGVGGKTAQELKEISQHSNNVLGGMPSEIKWMHSYVTGDKIYCVYASPNEELVRQHAETAGFPANSISQVGTVIDPSTGN
jgi:hypothetical protein